MTTPGRMVWPEHGQMWWARARLFGVGVAFALLGITWEMVRFVVQRLRVVVQRQRAAMPGSGILASYLGDVALYTENRYRWRPSDVLCTDAPRDAIRRRMVRGLVEMAAQGYDRWYVVA